MKKLLTLALLVAILGVGFNDGGRWFAAENSLTESTNDLASWAAINVGSMPADQAARALSDRAAPMGMRIYQYAHTPTGIELWTEKDVTGTLVVGPYIAMMRGVPFKAAIGAVFPVRYHVQTTYQ